MFVLLSTAAFAASAGLRAGDPLLPQIGEEYGVNVAAAAVVVTGYTVAYGLAQVAYGPLGDRFGKPRVITLACLASALCSVIAACAPGLDWLGWARLLAGAAAGGIIPMSMAHLGDTVPYEQRQPVLARFLSGHMLGMVAGQSLGGILGEHFGWRSVFLVLALVYAVVGMLLARDARAYALAPPTGGISGVRGLGTAYAGLARSPRVRLVVGVTFVEGTLFFGSFGFIGAHLRWDYGLDYDIIGAMLAAFGLGALAYAAQAPRIVAALGQTGLTLAGGSILCGGFLWVAAEPPAWTFPVILALLGFGFYLLHNTLQTLGTQMAPHARGIGMSVFAASLFLGQGIGVWAGGHLIGWTGYSPVFLGSGLGLLLLALLFGRVLQRLTD